LATWFRVVKTDGVLLKALDVWNVEIDGIAILGAAIGTAAGLHTAGVRKRRRIVARIVWVGVVTGLVLEALDFLVW
jgi:hypothetical protein